MSMIPKMALSWTLDNGANGTGEALVADWVAFERRFGKPVAAMSGEDFGLDQLAFLAWRCARRAGETAEYEDWIERVVEIDLPEVEPVPTSPASSGT